MLVEMKNIVMEFGPTRAVNDVSITVEPGTILGLLGENGAGKSTLMNVLAGTYLPSKGGVFINGQKVVMASAKVANQHGIRFIHQELNLCNDLKVFENMYLGSEISRGGLLCEEEMKRRCTEEMCIRDSTSPLSSIFFASTCAFARRWFWPIIRYLPLSRAAAAMASQSARVVAMGFSHSTCLPARSA